MIKHHPKFELLQSFVEGELPASLAAGVAIHADMCSHCQKKIAQLTEQVAETSFESSFLHQFSVNDQDDIAALQALDIEQMIDGITEMEPAVPAKPPEVVSVTFKGNNYQLPRALANMPMASTMNLGKLARARVQLDEGEIHTSLLHIEPGGGVPHHTHNGFELTVLLAGSFSDEQGEYHPGDFIMLDGNHHHNPVSAQGCLCYTVVNDSLHFTQGINRLLNPIGSFIY
ncbi:ChrR family anti-sigma-E factor [Thalassotalea sp. G2M2-11]|uniref:ChrR family anti-sigma-E factor n=1 Tax=Thalassotalea sp. G2M2-11 TaxID=2787627 RepID=UPI0019D1E4FF|nr:ChrR family anti-sigma-E factor [Thalassotalea sp. G2M2-11]